MLGLSAGISIKDDRLCGDFGDILDRPEAAGHVHQFDVRLTFGGTVAQGGDPHGVKLMGSPVLMDHSILYDKAGQAVMCLHGRNEALCLQDPLEPASPDIGHCQIRSGTRLDIRIFLVAGVGKLYKFPAVRSKDRDHLVPNRLLDAGAPVIPVHDDIRS